jgi:D-amino-acid dehydrogenase
MELLAELGIPCEVLGGVALRLREPLVKAGVVGAVRYPEEGHFDPAVFVTALATRLQGRGVEIRSGTEVTSIESDGRCVTRVRTNGRAVEARSVVIAAGAWSGSLGAALPLASQLQPGKGYSVTFASPAALPLCPLILGEAHVAVTPLPPTLRLAGTLELSGMDLSIDAGRVAALLRAPSHYLDGIEPGAAPEVWRGLRPCTPDGLPLVGRVAGLENLLLATGHAMLGMTLGPITGLLIAQLVCGESPALDVRPLDPNRWGRRAGLS